jgi:hypothetical protein
LFILVKNKPVVSVMSHVVKFGTFCAKSVYQYS